MDVRGKRRLVRGRSKELMGGENHRFFFFFTPDNVDFFLFFFFISREISLERRWELAPSNTNEAVFGASTLSDAWPIETRALAKKGRRDPKGKRRKAEIWMRDAEKNEGFELEKHVK